MIIASISISPIGVGTELHEFVKRAIEEIKKKGIKYEVNAMSTVVEVSSLEELFDVVKRAHSAVLDAGARRVITEVKIDDRRDKEATMESKISKVIS
ncbi:MAG: MTH1187 family thiamine-binding protein [Thermoplasmata archaeon]|nr:MTH1187 family thiamine-binding protein [Thermoplasmata archaeon]